VGYPGYLFTPGLDFDTSMPHAHPVNKDSVGQTNVLWAGPECAINFSS